MRQAGVVLCAVAVLGAVPCFSDGDSEVKPREWTRDEIASDSRAMAK